jgi:hypothetical protein
MGKYRKGAVARAADARKLSTGPVILIGAGVLILLAVVIWQLTLMPTTTVVQSSPTFDIPFPEIQRVALVDAKKAYDAGTALFLDVRDGGTYGSKHISGSINITLADLESRVNELPKDRWIITVCT